MDFLLKESICFSSAVFPTDLNTLLFTQVSIHNPIVKNVYFHEFLLYLVRSELVGVVEMSELRTWYEKVTRDDWLQLMCCALSDFHRLNLRGVRFKDLRRTRERLKLVEYLSRYLNWRNTWGTTVYILEGVVELGDSGTLGVSNFNFGKVIIREVHMVRAG